MLSYRAGFIKKNTNELIIFYQMVSQLHVNIISQKLTVKHS